MIVKENIFLPKSKEEVFTSLLNKSKHLFKNSRYDSYREFFPPNAKLYVAERVPTGWMNLDIIDFVDEDTGEVLTFLTSKGETRTLDNMINIPKIMDVGPLIFTLEDIEKLLL